MKRILQLTITTVLLLLVATGINAENYNGTLEHLDVKIQYSIGGGTVTKKGKFHEDRDHAYRHTVNVEGYVVAGTTMNISCKKLSGLTFPREESPTLGVYNRVRVEYIVYTTSTRNNGRIHKKFEDATAASASVSIPDDAVKVEVFLGYISSHNTVCCVSTWSVRKKGDNSPVRPTEPDASTTENQTGGTYKGTINRQGMTLEYTIKGVKMIKKEKPTYMGNNPKEGNYFQDYWVAVSSGSTVTVSCKKIKGKKDPIIMIRPEYYDNPTFSGGGIIDTNTMPRYKEKTETTVVQKKEYGQISISYLGDTGDWITITYHFNIDGNMDSVLNETPTSTTTPSTTAGNFKWNEVSDEHVCKFCKKPFSNYIVTYIKRRGRETETNTSMHCGYATGDNYHRSFRLAHDYTPIYVGDLFETDEESYVRIQGEVSNTNWIAIMQNSKVRLEGFVNGHPRWNVMRGTIVGQGLKQVEKGKPSFSTSNCDVELSGTTYVIQDNGTSSSVYLLDGSIKVTSKKKKTSYTLKPGQVSSVNKEGKITVKKFDVNAMARKYDINLSGTTTTGNTGLVFTADKINYKILSDKTVEVTSEVKGIYSGHVKIPAKVKHSGKEYQVVGIGPKAFADQTKMTSVEIPTSIRGIAEDAFLNTGLTQVVIPGDEVSIVKNAFRNCKKLTVALCSGKKPQCSPDAFNGCTAMKELRIKGISPSNNGKKLNGTNAVIKVIK